MRRVTLDTVSAKFPRAGSTRCKTPMTCCSDGCSGSFTRSRKSPWTLLSNMFLQRHLSQKWHDKTNSSVDHNDLSQGKMRFFTRLWYTTPAASPTAKKPEMTTGLAPITCRCVTGHREGSRARAVGSCALRDAWRGLPHGNTGNITQKGVERFPGIHCL